MESIKKLLPGIPKNNSSRVTERGEFLTYFLEQLNPPRVRDGYRALTIGRLSRDLQGIPTKDLYVLKKKCEEARGNGLPFGAIFWTEIRPKKEVV